MRAGRADLDGDDRWEPLVGLRSVYQPIVDILSGRIVGVEALARGMQGSAWESPAVLFDLARRDGRTAELDRACRIAAIDGALDAGLPPVVPLFINVEPSTVGLYQHPDFEAGAARAAAAGMTVVVEITERSLRTSIAEVLAFSRWAREQHWCLAVDDVGADPDSLTLLSLLEPDVIKLDLSVVQHRTTRAIASVVAAVNAEASLTGAQVLAEGIETDDHECTAVAMGANLGQGWHYARPAELADVLAQFPSGPAGDSPTLFDPNAFGPVAVRRRTPLRRVPITPWSLVGDRSSVRFSTKPLLAAMCAHLEEQSVRAGDPALIVAAFQDHRNLRDSTATRFARLAADSSLVVALGIGMPPEPVPGVVGTALEADDDLVSEWSLAVVGPHQAAALVAYDLAEGGAEEDRRFAYVVEYDRPSVLAVAASMLSRIGDGAGPGIDPACPQAAPGAGLAAAG